MRKIILTLFCINLAFLSACAQKKVADKPNSSEQKPNIENTVDLVSSKKVVETESFKFKNYLISLIEDGSNCVLNYKLNGVEKKLVLNIEAPCKFVRSG